MNKIKPVFFEFSSYEIDDQSGEIDFYYKMGFENKDPLVFKEKLVLPKNSNISKIPAGLLKNILNSVHLVLGISYYKLYCPAEMRVCAGMNNKQAEFWSTVYRKGLGEFCFRNKIDLKNIAKFSGNEDVEVRSCNVSTKNKCLLGIGGGKDSIVAAELLRERGVDLSAFVVETGEESKIVNDVLVELGMRSHKIKRYLDEKIFLDHPDSYNGHIPISAIIAFLGVLLAILDDSRYVVVANEYSSNFGNIEYQGETVNHQWSKSGEFEEMMQDYVQCFITPDVVYFSALRQFYEIRIVEMFSRYKKYFSIFSSCNNSFKIHKKRGSTLWCLECAKCVFMFAMLSAFLTREELIDIFGKNLYKDEGLLPLFGDLLGFGNMKPFDCVGTFEEMRAAMYLAHDKYSDDVVMKKLGVNIKDCKKYLEMVLNTQKVISTPVPFKFLGIKNVLILGYGKEGVVTEKYLKKNFKNLEIGVADKSKSLDYLQKQDEFDLIIKTPGIPKELVTRPYTTATNIFFSEINNLTIGVTGSKGKSTTASLIYTILKEAGKKVRLLGNIGEPMLGALMNPVSNDEIFVLEMSSYQLDDFEYAPSIAVMLNLFPDHMDYHGGVDNYYRAKKNIMKRQREGDYFVYNAKNKLLESWVNESLAQVVAVDEKMDLNDIRSVLLGDHNKANMCTAIRVAQLLDIPMSVTRVALEKFRPLPHRIEFVGEFGGIKFYDDAISTTPESTIAAIKALPDIGTIFLGGEDRDYDFRVLKKMIKIKGIKNAVLFPNSGKRILGKKDGVNILETDDMQKAVQFAYEHTEKGKICLLSTASPSYSIWKNFEAKGGEFQAMIKKYAKSRS